MSSIRRLLALASSLLLFQLTTLGHGVPCGTHARKHDMTSATLTVHASPAAPMSEAPADDGCDAPRPSRECTSMPACATALAVSPLAVAVTTVDLPSLELPEPLSIDSALPIGPEAPPPRV
ncbi:MAG TPA: hypothetical protein VKA54_03565 [Gemmatimonadaceae bacterium]|nr:hypothetical protein [Gemmatimonadaceae bacterium]